MSRIHDALMGREVGLVDADDTLWFNAQFYVQFVDCALAMIASTSNGGGKFSQKSLQDWLKLADPGEQGFADSILRFAHGLGVDRDTRIALEELADAFVHHPIELLPDVREAIVMLPCERLFLYTKGVESEQRRKIRESGSADWFDEIIVTDRKGVSELASLLEQRGLAGGDIFAIGNSIRHDIVPAAVLGAGVIWLNHSTNFYGNNAALPLSAIEVHGWKQVIDTIRQEKG